MNSPKLDITLDDLFRQALAPVADQEPPADMWNQVVRAVQTPTVERTAWQALVERFAQPRRGYSTTWHRFTSWVHSSMTYPPSSPHPTYWGSDGKCHSSLFAGVVFMQIRDLRHAS